MSSRKLLVFALMAMLGAMAAQDKPKPQPLTADRVLDQYEKAVKAPGAVPFKTMHYVVEIYLRVGGRLSNREMGSIEGWFNSDGRYVEKFLALSHGSYMHGFNGREYWYSALPSVSDKGVDLPKEFKRTDAPGGLDPLHYAVQLVPFRDGWRKSFREVKILGQGMVEGHRVIVIRGTALNGDSINYYFDATTMLLLKSDFPTRFKNVNEDVRVTETTRVYQDYVDYSGWKLPRTIRFGDASSLVDYYVHKIEWNVAIDDSMFEQPK